MRYTPKDHTFAVCAYKESPYLRECIESLKSQSVKSRIIVATSTDNEYIRNIAKEYNLPYYVNHGEKGIAGDWNFAYKCAKTELVTLAHQDDKYGKEYLRDALTQLNRAKNPIIYHSDYCELRNGEVVEKSGLLLVKRILLLPFRPKFVQDKKFFKRLSLAFGNPVCCPSVCYVKSKLPETVFVSDYMSNLDWEEWEKLSKVEGTMVYSKRRVTFHRVHEGSETTNAINSGNIRAKEDLDMFKKFWPDWFAKFLMLFYIKAEKLNNN